MLLERPCGSANPADQAVMHGCGTTHLRGPAAEANQLLPIRNRVVPHSPQDPRVAGRPFFIVTDTGFWTGRFSRHFMQ